VPIRSASEQLQSGYDRQAALKFLQTLIRFAIARDHEPMPEIQIRSEQSIELLKALHILTRDGKMNQDSRRKLKQVYHLVQFIEPLLSQVAGGESEAEVAPTVSLADHGAGKSYLGFILYDLFFRLRKDASIIHSIETRAALVDSARALADSLGFERMLFHHLSVAESITAPALPERFDIVTALHACDTATDDAISFALAKQARFIVLVPCCQAEVAAELRRLKGQSLARETLTEIWRHPIHTREFGSHMTNVLRCLQLEAHGYQVNVTELVGWEHSMKNELIIATYKDLPRQRPTQRLQALLQSVGLESMQERFWVRAPMASV